MRHIMNLNKGRKRVFVWRETFRVKGLVTCHMINGEIVTENCFG